MIYEAIGGVKASVARAYGRHLVGGNTSSTLGYNSNAVNIRTVRTRGHPTLSLTLCLNSGRDLPQKGTPLLPFLPQFGFAHPDLTGSCCVT